MKKAKELSALAVSRLTQEGHHAVGGVAGLYLYVNKTGARSWVLRVMVGSKRRHMGLGGYPDVPLAEAREKARSAKKQIEDGIDPIAQRQQVRSKLIAQQSSQKTFKDAAKAYIEAHGDSWKNPKHRAQWSSTLERYAYPVLGDLLIQDVDQANVLKVLEPIWKEKNETASRLRGRIETILDWATVRKYRSGENPARWKGHLDKLLAAPKKIQKTEHRKAVAVEGAPAFMQALRQMPGIAARALEFAILCASRSGEVRAMTWSEVDLDKALWTIPDHRMKAGKEHRVPLSNAALELIKRQPKIAGSNMVFPGARGGALSDMTLTAVMRRMKVDAVPHGFRSTFRDWAGDKTHHPRDVVEMALAHVIENKAEAAYRRSDALDKRRRLMNDWATYLHSQQ